MKTLPISLTTIEQVKSFANDIIAVDYELDVSSERYVINAKSILGLFSLDLTKPLQLTIHADDSDDLSDVMDILEPYMTKTAKGA